ncbi:unnamed protein product [Dracunculus medinensis]|uniref:G_PROTEIN_RECEP_F1_2 domain-containing protein n=1 Tax=Dracunculus medinensis TaxID=318479 RepID=A0A0N4UPH0_DRAME|nr:unnamed protein product [Dracunculus medinensis]
MTINRINLLLRPQPGYTHKIFIFGICILFGWMIVIIICANPMVSYFTLLTLLLLHRKFARGSVEIQMSTTWTFKKQVFPRLRAEPHTASAFRSWSENSLSHCTS